MKFHRYEVHGVKDHGDYATIVPDDDADFFTIFGFVQSVSGGEFAIAIGDHGSRDQALLARDLILGQ